VTEGITLGLVNTFAQELDGCYVPHAPQGFPKPRVVALNKALLEELGLDATLIQEHAAGLFSGSLVAADSQPLAQAYAGHQFGGFSPQLGDGRALLIGEVDVAVGDRRDIQLKGSGPTPFSRGGDGKATLGPILREYLVGEAMHHLGVPTTRVLAALRTGETVYRNEPLPGAVLARVAASHLRVGTLQFFAARRMTEALERIVTYALKRHYPEQADAANPARALLREVAKRQAALVAHWMDVGFIHGVMNTDNTTLSGETIDYGPCAFMDAFDPATVFSSIDRGGRYAYANQPGIAQWNLARMGEALIPLLHEERGQAIAIVESELERFAETFTAIYQSRMRAKLGLQDADESDASLVDDLQGWMHATQQDYTNTFRRLAGGLRNGALPFDGGDFEAWHARWLTRLGDQGHASVADAMDAVNPLYIPRNHLVEAALDAAVAGDYQPFRTFLEVLSAPFSPQAGREPYAEPAPEDFGPYQTFCGT